MDVKCAARKEIKLENYLKSVPNFGKKKKRLQRNFSIGNFFLNTYCTKWTLSFHTTLRHSATFYNELCSISSSSSSSQQARRHSYLATHCLQQNEYQPQLPCCFVSAVWPQPVSPSWDTDSTCFGQNQGWKLETNNSKFIILWLQESMHIPQLSTK